MEKNDNIEEQNVNVENESEVVKEEVTNETASDNNDNAENEPHEMTLEEQLVLAETNCKQAKEQYLRTLADFDNYRKNSIKDKANALKYKSETLAKDVVSVIDDFERAIDSFDKCDDIASMKDGVLMIYNKLIKVLKQNGIEAMDIPDGTKFDTNRHEAVSMVPVADASQDGNVIYCAEKGYMILDKVMRYAKVCVGKAASEE